MFWKKSLEKLKAALEKTRKALASGISSLFRLGRKVDEELLHELEEKLIMADIGVITTRYMLGAMQKAYKSKEVTDVNEIMSFLKQTLHQCLTQGGNDIIYAPTPPTVVLVVGVNGSGKTTSVAKLAAYFSAMKKSVLLAASDTFRAAAIEQLEKWAQRVQVNIIKQATGADPAAVAFDAAEAALSRKADVLIIDTAGRLHTQKNLMQELSKIYRVIGKKIPGAPHEVLLVLDATTGQNAILQAKAFKDAVQVSGLFLAKLDGTAKGGVVLAIQKEVNVPVKFIGIGEHYEDIEPFDAQRFVDALLS
jgi:fused signal recognition particle receptor